MEVEDASFSTVTFSISLGFSDVNTSLDTGAPSNIYKGEVPAFKEVYPRTRMEEDAVGSPEEVNTCIPATCP